MDHQEPADQDRIDTEYIRYLMLYSDQKYPFEKAKADPGLSESVRGVKRYMRDHGDTRKLEKGDGQRILLQEKHAREQARKQRILERLEETRLEQLTDRKEEFTPKAESKLNEIEQNFKTKADLENELAILKKMVMDKEAELKATAPKGQPKSQDNGIIERKLEDTGYSDKINNT